MIADEAKKEWFTICLPLLRRNVSEHLYDFRRALPFGRRPG